jgi:hypothetical protein
VIEPIPIVPKGTLYLNEAEKTSLETRNGVIQARFVFYSITQWTEGDQIAPALLLEFQWLAVNQIYRCAGHFRDDRVTIMNSAGKVLYEPPDHTLVPALVQEMCDYVNQNWTSKTPIHLSAYAMWRLNWIHPFFGGNGRTARAFSYLVLCIGLQFVPPANIIRRGFTLGRQSEPPLVHRVPYIPKLEEDNVRQGFLEPEQYEKVLEKLPQRLKALFVCAYHVGSRSGEIRKIQWPQVDFDARLIHLSARQTKGKAARSLPIYGDMERWLRKQEEGRAPDCPWVFSFRGRAIGDHLRGWRKACEAAGVPGLLFHDLRRSAVRNMKRAGVQDKVAMQISGHKTRAVFDRYNIIDEGDLARISHRQFFPPSQVTVAALFESTSATSRVKIYRGTESRATCKGRIAPN